MSFADLNFEPRFTVELGTPERIAQGLYHGCLSWVLRDEDRTYKKEFPTVGRTLREVRGLERLPDEDSITTRILDGVGEFSCYGSCDSPEQFLATPLGRWLAASPRKFAVGFTHIRADDEQDGGYRWHKNGRYIGLLGEPQCEYLMDEPVIRNIYQFHVYEVLP